MYCCYMVRTFNVASIPEEKARPLEPVNGKNSTRQVILTQTRVNLNMGDVYSGAGSAVADYNFRKNGLLSTLSNWLSKSAFKVVKELIVHPTTQFWQ